MTTPGLDDSISGVILCDETIRQHTSGGDAFAAVLVNAGIVPGIKVDLGAQPMAAHPGEKVTEGLDGLRERLAGYAALGARFAKWRAVFTIGETLPSRACVQANAHALARYAALCQEAELVPIVEPEVLMAGEHPLTRCGEVTEDVLREALLPAAHSRCPVGGHAAQNQHGSSRVDLPDPADVEEVAEATICCLRRVRPRRCRRDRVPVRWPIR